MAILALGAIASSIGCGGNPLGREDIAGSITLDGQPLDQGMISFEPQQRGKGHVGSGTTIKDGHYAIPAEKGLPPGEYIVRIHSAATRGGRQAGAADAAMPGMGGGAGIERIPAKYNIQTGLNVAVTDGGANEFNFELRSR